VDVRLTYDHRVLDGGTVARALADLERYLTHELLAELRYLEAVDAA
jgi:pyruvate/2-oxoglutarate dehydrogenase complex dihydrolipoamide acyltransferase (E2) component